MLVYFARREGLIGCVGVCCLERGIDRVLCWCGCIAKGRETGCCAAREEGVTGCFVGMLSRERECVTGCWRRFCLHGSNTGHIIYTYSRFLNQAGVDQTGATSTQSASITSRL